MIRALTSLLLAATVLTACECSRPPTQQSLKREKEACVRDEDCETGLCEGPVGLEPVCARKCGDRCNPGDVCTQLTPGRYSCQPEKGGVCGACTVDSDCPYPSDKCIVVDGASVCGRDCSFDQACPTSYTCLRSALGADNQPKSQQCAPVSQTCACTAANTGMSVGCQQTNGSGTCTGMKVCDGVAGYGACSARVPAAEVCNGVDDDCDGQTDEGLSQVTCGRGACQRTINACVAGTPVTCTPGMPSQEVCNGMDDDCDGAVDNGVSTTNDVNNCGMCGRACMLANATPACRTGQCEVSACNTPFDNCDGLHNNGCEANLQSDSNNCGACNRRCNQPGSNGSCVMGQCQYTCATGFIDLDQDPTNGCEYQCTATSAVDLPDVNFVDSNCDGIDGEVLNGVFVSTTGDNTQDGTMALPVRTVARGLELAVQQGKRDVYVSVGSFSGTVTLNGVTNKILAGGYSPSPRRWSRTASNVTTLSGGNPGLVLNAAHGSTVQFFTINGAAASGFDLNGNGNSAYGAQVIDTADAGLELLTITAGDGADGQSRMDQPAGQPGNPGGNGMAGCVNDTYAGCPRCMPPSAGQGGTSMCNGQSRRGGAGGPPGYSAPTDGIGGLGNLILNSTTRGGAGQPGELATPQGTGSNPSRWESTQASDGGFGTSGGNGNNASPAAQLGALTVAGYLPPAGTSSTPGGMGEAGGGGGGGGGGCTDLANLVCWCWSYGSTGGGGGGGGCGGEGGLTGGMGGASFGLMVVNSRVRGVSNDVTAGRGGNGGTGASGGPGGSGGRGGVALYDFGAQGTSGRGGNGGAGGRGGNGGHGAGGNGGPSLGLAHKASVVNYMNGFVLRPGTAGSAGMSRGAGGLSGVPGYAGQEFTFP